MNRALRLSVLSLALLAAGGCRRHKPSPEYMQAQLQFDALHDQLGDDAFIDPGMSQVESLLDQVSPNSADADKAAALKAKIASERARVTAESAARRAAIADAMKTPSFQFSTPSPTPVGVPREAADADAGPPEPYSGMPVSELLQYHARCFEPGPQVSVDGKGMHDTYQLKDLGVCRDQHPRFVESVLIIEDGKVLGWVRVGDMTKKVPMPVDSGAPAPAPAPSGTSASDDGGQANPYQFQ